MSTVWEALKKHVAKLIVLGIVGIPVLVWFLIVGAGYAPVVSMQLESVQVQVTSNTSAIAGNARAIQWIKLKNIENFLKRGGLMRTRQQCVDYYSLVKELGYTPVKCEVMDNN